MTLHTNCNALLYPIIYESVHLCTLPAQLLSWTIISKLLFRYELCHAREWDKKMLMSMHECWLMKVKWLQIYSLHSFLWMFRLKQWVLMRDSKQIVLIDSSWFNIKMRVKGHSRSHLRNGPASLLLYWSRRDASQAIKTHGCSALVSGWKLGLTWEGGGPSALPTYSLAASPTLYSCHNANSPVSQLIAAERRPKLPGTFIWGLRTLRCSQRNLKSQKLHSHPTTTTMWKMAYPPSFTTNIGRDASQAKPD